MNIWLFFCLMLICSVGAIASYMAYMWKLPLEKYPSWLLMLGIIGTGLVLIAIGSLAVKEMRILIMLIPTLTAFMMRAVSALQFRWSDMYVSTF